MCVASFFSLRFKGQLHRDGIGVVKENYLTCVMPISIFSLFDRFSLRRNHAVSDESLNMMAYKPGDVVIENDPFALAVLDKMIPMVCSWCLKPASKTSKKSPLSLCAGCKTLKYCSPACQKEDWSKGPHKKECKYLKNNKKHQMPVPNCKVRLIARCDH